MSFINGSIQNIFGNGLLGTAATGLVRIPAFMSNCIAVLMVGELTIRALANTLSAVGYKPADDSWIQTAANSIKENGARPYVNHETKTLLIQAVAFSVLGIVGSEFVRVAGGTAPAIYNNVLAFLGPIRIDTSPYLDGVRKVLALAGITI